VIPYIFRIKDGIGLKWQELCGKVLTLHIRNILLFTAGFRPNHWAALYPPVVLNFSLVRRRSKKLLHRALLKNSRCGPVVKIHFYAVLHGAGDEQGNAHIGGQPSQRPDVGGRHLTGQAVDPSDQRVLMVNEDDGAVVWCEQKVPSVIQGVLRAAQG
jgi:hypothetical protein